MIDSKYQLALAEVNEILEYTEPELVQKIPEKVRTFIQSYAKKEYTKHINPNISICEQPLLKETEAILSLLFRNYWATEEEKIELEEKDKLEYQELKENTQIAFLKEKNIIEGAEQSTSVVNVEILPWYKKIFLKFRNIFHKGKF